jgi:hypothetical protein
MEDRKVGPGEQHPIDEQHELESAEFSEQELKTGDRPGQGDQDRAPLELTTHHAGSDQDGQKPVAQRDAGEAKVQHDPFGPDEGQARRQHPHGKEQAADQHRIVEDLVPEDLEEGHPRHGKDDSEERSWPRELGHAGDSDRSELWHQRGF